jgi:hypothetical protein
MVTLMYVVNLLCKYSILEMHLIIHNIFNVTQSINYVLVKQIKIVPIMAFNIKL